MGEQSVSEVIRKFRESADRESLTEDIKVVCRVKGGMPSQRIEQEFTLLGSGKTTAMVRDVRRSTEAQEASVELDGRETRHLLQQIGSGLDSLLPRSEARFLPDSLVGSITVEVGGEEATLYFLPEEEERLAQDKPIAPQMAEAIRRISKTSQQLLKEAQEKR